MSWVDVRTIGVRRCSRGDCVYPRIPVHMAGYPDQGGHGQASRVEEPSTTYLPETGSLDVCLRGDVGKSEHPERVGQSEE